MLSAGTRRTTAVRACDWSAYVDDLAARISLKPIELGWRHIGDLRKYVVEDGDASDMPVLANLCDALKRSRGDLA